MLTLTKTTSKPERSTRQTILPVLLSTFELYLFYSKNVGETISYQYTPSEPYCRPTAAIF